MAVSPRLPVCNPFQEGETQVRKTDDPLSVHFFPSLYDIRQSWILKLLRQESVSSILDVGCGEGTLLATLCSAPAWLPVPSEDTGATSDLGSEAMRKLVKDCFEYVRPTKLVGLDINPVDLEQAIIRTAPEDLTLAVPTSYFLTPLRRWTQLEVEIWEGSLADYNSAMCDLDCIVSCEVIEHLPPQLLSKFAPMLLGVYAPRVLLLTTPSYDYNARFHHPDTPEHRRGGFPDPSGRTSRVFRHPDHKFEWTRAEFRHWCDDTASTWGYDIIECTTQGVCGPKDEWGRESFLGGASQVAAFRRRDGPRERLCREQIRMASISEVTQKLLARHVYPADDSSARPKSQEDIMHAVISVFRESHTVFMSVYQLWTSGVVSGACGGYLHLMLDALNLSDDVHLIENLSEEVISWDVKYPKLEEEMKNEVSLPQEQVMTDDEGSDEELASDGWAEFHSMEQDERNWNDGQPNNIEEDREWSAWGSGTWNSDSNDNGEWA